MRKKLPDKWSTRTVKRFLLFPLTLPISDNGGGSDRHLEKRWMERAKIVQRYEPYQSRIGAPCFWEDSHWFCGGG